MIVLVCGGRDYANWHRVYQVLDHIHEKVKPISLIIHGGADGADKLAGQWADDTELPAMEVKADWKRYGTGAGPVRNQRMIDDWHVDIVVAFPGGRGTEDMIKRALNANIPVKRIDHVEPEPNRRDSHYAEKD